MFYSILLLIGIIVWPELAFCVFLFTQGYPILAIVAFLTTFGSGSAWARQKISVGNQQEKPQ